jgi:hypothetical protein
MTAIRQTALPVLEPQFVVITTHSVFGSVLSCLIFNLFWRVLYVYLPLGQPREPQKFALSYGVYLLSPTLSACSP